MKVTKKVIPFALMLLLVSFGYQKTFGANESEAKRFVVQTVGTTFEVNTPIAMSVTAISQTWATMKSYVWDIFIEVDKLTYGRDYLVPSSGLYTFTSWDQGSKVFANWLVIKKAWTYTIRVSDIIDEKIQWTRTITITDSSNNTTSANTDSIDTVINWLYDNGLTVFSTPATFHTERNIRRDEAAKFISLFAQEILYQQWESDPVCYTFNDIAETNSLKDYITQSCELWYMKWANNKFNPSGNLSNQQAIAIVMRTYEWRLDEPKSDRSKNYYARAKELGITDWLPLANKKAAISRGNFATLVYRVAKMNEDQNPIGTTIMSWVDTLFSWINTMLEGLISMLWFHMNSYNGVTPNFINQAGICSSWANTTIETNFDMVGMNFSMKIYRQIQWFTWNQCKVYERIDEAKVSISSGQILSGLANGLSQIEIDTQIAEVQSGLQASIGKDGTCMYTTGVLLDNLQKESSGEFIPIPNINGEESNCTWTLYESN